MRKFLIMLLLSLTACVATGGASADSKLEIVCTSFPCYDFARAVAGDAARVSLLIKPGSEVHSYEPTPADILAMAQSDLFIYVGGESDAWVTDILSSFGGDAPRTLRLFDVVDALEEETREGMTLGEAHDSVPGELEYDEHIWTSPVNAMKMVSAVADALSAIMPERAADFARGAADYQSEIGAIDADFRQIVQNGARRELIFADRFPFLYFVREYGLEYCAAFPSCASESEPSARTLAYLMDRVVSDGIPAVYTIELSSGKTAQAIAEQTGAKILTFYSCQNLSEADFSAGETYVSLMRRNVEALKEGLN